MNEHPVDTMTAAALRDLDPAPATVLTDAERERADATFARILATPGRHRSPEAPVRPRRRRSRLLVPWVWSAPPAPPSPRCCWAALRLRVMDADARAAHGRGRGRGGPTCRAVFAMPDQGEQVVIAERRGEWTYVLLAGPQAEAACLMPEGLVGPGGPRRAQEEGFMGSTYGPDDTRPRPGPGAASSRYGRGRQRAHRWSVALR